MLDLANLAAAGSEGVAQYARAWQQLTGQLLAGRSRPATDGPRFKSPFQYLPWAAKHRPSGDVDAMLAQAERALELLPRTETRMT
jgi:hypothetical protein